MSTFFIMMCVFFPMIGAFISYCAGTKNKKLRDITAVLVSAVTFVCALFEGGQANIQGVFGMGLTFNVSGMQKILSVLCAFIWLCSQIFSTDYLKHEHGKNRYHLFSLLTLGAAQGVFLSNDLFTTFVFFEMMSFTSYVTVKQTQEDNALRAGQTYLAIAVSCGMAALLGLFMLYAELKTLRFDSLFTAAQGANGNKLFIASVLLLIGYGAKAGMFPVHVWLPDTHPAAPAPFSAILSCILTKTGVFGVLVISCKLMRVNVNWGQLITLLGAITMALGAVLAIFSIDLKRTLACSSLSQIGFILVGIGTMVLLGEEGSLSMDGTIAHIVNHSFIKLVLFTAAGVIVMNKETLNLNKLMGYGRGKWLLTITFLLAALSVSGIPGFGGYISKTLLHEGIVEYGKMPVIEWVFIISGGCTLAYMTKLFVCIFIEKGEGYEGKKPYLTVKSALVLIVSACVMPVFGLFPKVTLNRVGSFSQAFMGGEGILNHVEFFGAECLLGGLKSIVIGIAVYFLVIRLLLKKDGKYINVLPKWLSLENSVYRPIVCVLLPKIGRLIALIPNLFADSVILLMKKSVFNKDDAKFTPKESTYFGKYSPEPFLRRGFTDTLAFSFLLLGISVVLGLIYILSTGLK